MDQRLTFSATPWTLAGSLLLVAVTAWFAWTAWRRTGYARGTGMLEGLRVVIVLLIAVTWNQPELQQSFVPEQRATLAVLWDDSRSMETRDLVDEQRPRQPARERRVAIEAFVQPEFWGSSDSDLQVVLQPFSSELDHPRDGTDLNDALIRALERHPNLRAVVLFSDGDWNTGEPPVRAAGRLRVRNIPVFPVAVGSESRLPDVELVSVDAPTFGVVSKAIRIPFVIQSSLPRDYDVTVQLRDSQGAELSKSVRVPAMGQLVDAFLWKPQETGPHRLTVHVPFHTSEVVRDNNRLEVPVSVREEALRVLLIEATPRWEYRYLRNALERDPGVEVACLLFHPELSKVGGGKGYLSAFPNDVEALTQFDVVFLGDVGVGEGQLTDEQCRLIKGLVRNQAAGLILMPGFRGRQFTLLDSELEELYPVVLDERQPRGWGSRIPAQFELTETGRRSLLTRLADEEEANVRIWETLPGFHWYAPVLRAKAGTEVLAAHHAESNRYGPVPLLVTKMFGTGKVLFMGTDGAWRWREGVEDLFHYRFWGQVARWMAYQRQMAQGEQMRLFYSPDRPRAGDLITLNANVMNAGGAPLESGTVIAQIVAPSGNTETVRFSADGNDWGLFTGRLTPQESGTYQVTLSARETPATLETEITVQGTNREKVGRPARPDVLEEIAEITGGQLTPASQVARLLDRVAALPEPEPLIRRQRLWSPPFWAGLMVVLMGVFWTGRKMVGVI